MQSIFKSHRPFLIAGPCSAETEEQVLKTAHALKEIPVDLFRAGIWKPRTRPGAFEGIGEEGLKWLQRVKNETGLKTTVEVANTNHLELALKYEMDVLWIGARTTVNPFLIQEIAEALRGVSIPVMIKNPVNPDLKLWMGAIERFQLAGIQDIAAVHRGFTSFEKEKYRNDPMWQIPIELKRIMPAIPLICDPSHIGGKRELLQVLAQKAMDLNFDGLMIETHPDPDQAWTDKAQQITPAEFKILLQNLVLREEHSDDVIFQKNITEMRSMIDQLDEKILRILSERMKIAEQVGLFKKENNITVFQLERWNEIVLTRSHWADEHGLSPELILRLWQLIHQEAIQLQMKVMNEPANNESVRINE